jgi:hypothetical protein
VSAGWYKRRRGLLEHVESGTIDLLESGIHDYLSLKANVLIGSPSSIPVGVCFTSAPAIRPYCKRWVKCDRTMQRVLDHMEKIGWIKTWPARSGNYPVLICRATVRDLSGNEYRINGEKTANWKHPAYEPVGGVSGSASISDGTLTGFKEGKTKKEGRKKRAAKAAPPADPRFQQFVDFAYRSFEAKHGQRPAWNGKDFNGLKALLSKNQNLTLAELERRWTHYAGSTEPFTTKQGDSLAYFCSKFDVFISGPIAEKGKPNAKDAIARTIADSPLDENGRLKTVVLN